MRAGVQATAAAVLLVSPAVLAAFHGGYGEEARLVAGVAAWLLVAVVAVAAPVALPRSAPGRLAVGGLAALLALTLASLAWAPIAATTYGDAQRVALYLGVLIAGVALLRTPRMANWVVPALAANATAIVLVGLSERLAPWLVTLERTAAAGGRLSAPLGYWNAMGAVAAIGLVLCAGLAGDRTRASRFRAAAAAAAPLLGAGVALSYSRGAILAAAAGLAVVLLMRPERSQLAAAIIAAGAAAVAGIVAVALPDVGDLTAAEGRRSVQGAVLTAVIVGAGAAAWLAQRATMRSERPPGDERDAVAGAPIVGQALGVDDDRGSVPGGRAARRRLGVVAAIVLVVAGVAALAAAESGPRTGDPAFGARAERLRTVESNRYAYWRVAVATWADHPVLGAGSGAFAVEWLRRRTVAEGARDAHSLPLETAAELGLAGLLALGLLVAGVIGGVVGLQRRVPGAGAAAAGGLAAWGVHATLDWAWEMPSVTLLALLLAALLIAAGEERQAARGRQSAEPTAIAAATA